MRFISSIFMMLTATCAVISAYFFGHWLVVRHEHHNWPLMAFFGLLAAAAVFGVIYLKLAKNDPQPVAHGGHGGHDAHGAHTHTHPDGTVHTHPHGPGHH